MASERTQEEIDAERIRDDDDMDGWIEMMCGMSRDGQCGQAGSEFCDFECPIMRDVRAGKR